ncbi:uncharacterized protein BDZ99DRAFT_477347 [Mytilinidion resinicola]|uniref:Uncharacterized protein n=1 Tax=Mytilinidion resinicola TaxID=574789 RepID=A0A6A6YJV3_9PEZI|nr:uncharacterized protein BDZ99DRAFT_477347 [Mytilinidion resinicola]KAF2808838.1 hypothetical protein BDZ99DRAFT_477347 [Mytilinidion resinicola]
MSSSLGGPNQPASGAQQTAQGATAPPGAPTASASNAPPNAPTGPAATAGTTAPPNAPTGPSAMTAQEPPGVRKIPSSAQDVATASLRACLPDLGTPNKNSKARRGMAALRARPSGQTALSAAAGGVGRATGSYGGSDTEMGEGLPYGDEGVDYRQGSEEGELRAVGTAEEEEKQKKLREAQEALDKRRLIR